MSHENPDTAKIFLNLEDTPETQGAMTAGGSDDGFAQEQPAAPQRPQQMNSSPSVASGPAIAALIVLIGGGSIFGMRVVSGQAAVSKDAFEMNVTEPVIGADFDQRFEATMTALEQSTRPVQVPLGYIPRDPFNFSDKESTGIKPVVTDLPDPIGQAERDRLRAEAMRIAREAQMQRERLVAMQDSLDGYQLQSTLQGPNAVARISGEIVRVGGTLSYEIKHEEAENETSFFTVESIGGRTAVLLADDGSRYELQIGMPTRQLEAAPEPEPVEPEGVETPADETGSADDGEQSLFVKIAAAAAAAKENAEADTETTETDAGETDASETDAGEAESGESEGGASDVAESAPEADTTDGTDDSTDDSTDGVADEGAESESPAAEESAETEEAEGSAESEPMTGEAEPSDQGESGEDAPVESDTTDTAETPAEVADDESDDSTTPETTDSDEANESDQGESGSGESGSDEAGSDETGSNEDGSNEDGSAGSDTGESGSGEAEPVEEAGDDSETGEPAPESGEGGEGR